MQLQDFEFNQEQLKLLSQVALLNENGVVFADTEGKIFWTNDGFLQITGFSREEILGKTPIEIGRGPLSDKDTLTSMVTDFQRGQSFRFEIKHYRKDRSWFWARVRSRAIFTPKGRLSQYFATIEDISQEKELEIQNRFRIAFEKIGDNVWEHDFVTGKTSFSNSKNDFIGDLTSNQTDNAARWWQATLIEDRVLLEENDKKYKAGLIDHHLLEYRLIDNYGKIHWVLDRGVVIEKTPDGLPLKIIGTHTDITERKHTELAQQINENKYRSIIANMNLGLIEVDLDDKILFAYQSFCQMSGYEETELLGKNASVLFLPEESLAVMEEKNNHPQLKPDTMPTSNPLDEKLYSLTYFEEIASGDTDFIKKMVTMFVELTPDLVAQMLKAYEAQDLNEMSRLAHKVKPSIDNMGISSIHAAIREIERAGKAGEDSQTLATLQQEVKTVIDKVIDQIKKEYLVN